MNSSFDPWIDSTTSLESSTSIHDVISYHTDSGFTHYSAEYFPNPNRPDSRTFPGPESLKTTKGMRIKTWNRRIVAKNAGNILNLKDFFIIMYDAVCLWFKNRLLQRYYPKWRSASTPLHAEVPSDQASFDNVCENYHYWVKMSYRFEKWRHVTPIILTLSRDFKALERWFASAQERRSSARALIWAFVGVFNHSLRSYERS